VALSRGNGFRLGNFLFLLAIAFFIVVGVLTILIGILAALAMGEGRASAILSGSVSSAVTAFALAYFAALAIAIYRQLFGIAPDDDRA
jgi:cation transporter-like permease